MDVFTHACVHSCLHCDESTTKAERLRDDVVALRRELEGVKRAARGTDGENKSRDVRLNRALEEARKVGYSNSSIPI